MHWIREPENYKIENDRIEIVTQPHTDLWQRTYYHFRNDNAPVLQMETEELTQLKEFVFQDDLEPFIAFLEEEKKNTIKLLEKHTGIVVNL